MNGNMIPALRSGSLLLVMMMIAADARAADCPAGGNVQRQAECVHDQMAPDVIGKLYGATSPRAGRA